MTRFNALRHGILSRYTVLPWEDPDEYETLLSAFVAEHAPQGPTEEHLVEELAGIVWRKRRLRLAEASAARHGLKHIREFGGGAAGAALAQSPGHVDGHWMEDAITLTPETAAEQLRDMEEDEAMTRRALALLAAGGDGAYEAALAELRDDTRAWWQDEFAETPDRARMAPQDVADALRRFLEGEVMRWFAKRRQGLAALPQLWAQAEGDALDRVMVDRLTRYETHLDRKFERTLAMLLKLRQLREPDTAG